MHLYDDGFNLLSPIDINGKKVTPISLFRKMTAEEVTDWYEARMSTYGTGCSSKVIEEKKKLILMTNLLNLVPTEKRVVFHLILPAMTKAEKKLTVSNLFQHNWPLQVVLR